MAETKFKVGDRVRVIRDNSSDFDRGDVVYITFVDRYSPHQPYRASASGQFESGSNWLNEDEIELIANGEEVKPYRRKTYRLIKELPELRKGALVQEGCDDGNQDYVALNPQTDVKYKDEDGDLNACLPREAVENEPKWFVEVFKVSPEYQTREELDLWEAFQKNQAKVRVTKPVAKRVPRKTKKAA